jgi:radical SAM superfamily enzyme
MSKLERKRFSILTKDLTRCYICGMPKQHLHEIYFGKNRNNSMIYGCVVPLCYEHHEGNTGVHHNIELDTKLKKECQKQFEKTYSTPFIDIFYKNYI